MLLFLLIFIRTRCLRYSCNQTPTCSFEGPGLSAWLVAMIQCICRSKCQALDSAASSMLWILAPFIGEFYHYGYIHKHIHVTSLTSIVVHLNSPVGRPPFLYLGVSVILVQVLVNSILHLWVRVFLESRVSSLLHGTIRDMHNSAHFQ